MVKRPTSHNGSRTVLLSDALRRGGRWSGALALVALAAFGKLALTLGSGHANAAPTTPPSMAVATDDNAPHRRPVKVIAPERLKLKTAQGEVLVPAYSSVALGDMKAQPGIRRAVIVVHGRLRDADRYFELAGKALKASGAEAETLLIAPQIMTTADAARHDLPTAAARWKNETWLGGEPAKGPYPVSSFEIFDSIAALLADRARFPNLERIVFAAHSGGAQLVQRYAVVGRADQVITAAGLHPVADGADNATAGKGSIRLRYVVANPSSYLYFDAQRPVNLAHCREQDRWRYGLTDPVPYVTAQGDARAFESRYFGRRVIYLLGGNDIDPNHSALDKSCAGEAQGAFRLERGNNYFAHLQRRAKAQNLTLRHSRVEVPGVGHEAERMFSSVCGKAALFDTAGCDMKPGEAMTAPK
jgi:hypothetical protein